ncbi:hypothetical protein VDP25_14600 [Winogradskyella sp. ECml5-4]|uniref:hypothetical protein n=1 Tax=Winogradskyella sp. ECml5-4 TaxID=3110975 RepID=UPI002FF2B281
MNKFGKYVPFMILIMAVTFRLTGGMWATAGAGALEGGLSGSAGAGIKELF